MDTVQPSLIQQLNGGREHEKVAVDSYLLKARELHPPLTYQATGLVVREALPHLGASPDGLVYCPHCNPYHGVIEVKCPYSFKDMHPKEVALSDNFFCSLDENKILRLKKNHAYYYQVQGKWQSHKESGVTLLYGQ